MYQMIHIFIIYLVTITTILLDIVNNMIKIFTRQSPLFAIRRSDTYNILIGCVKIDSEQTKYLIKEIDDIIENRYEQFNENI